MTQTILLSDICVTRIVNILKKVCPKDEIIKSLSSNHYEQLSNIISKAKEQGIENNVIITHLKKKGWKKRAVRKIMEK